MTTQDRAARALDLTHVAASKKIGIHTDRVRGVLAAYLDGVLKLKASTVRAYCGYLEMIARA
jgi:hypothetical protein